jgi:hypothetical protein
MPTVERTPQRLHIGFKVKLPSTSLRAGSIAKGATRWRPRSQSTHPIFGHVCSNSLESAVQLQAKRYVLVAFVNHKIRLDRSRSTIEREIGWSRFNGWSSSATLLAAANLLLSSAVVSVAGMLWLTPLSHHGRLCARAFVYGITTISENSAAKKCLSINVISALHCKPNAAKRL